MCVWITISGTDNLLSSFRVTSGHFKHILRESTRKIGYQWEHTNLKFQSDNIHIKSRMLSLHRANDAETLSYVEQILSKNGLPSEDVQSAPASFYIAVQDGDRVGIGGLETHDSNGLLRSIVVQESYRDRGIGTSMCAELEKKAMAADVETLYLLTTTAADFFRNHGYDRIRRDDVPAQIQETTQFDELCPETATCLFKPL